MIYLSAVSLELYKFNLTCQITMDVIINIDDIFNKNK